MLTEKEALSTKISHDKFEFVDINKINRVDKLSGKPTTFLLEVLKRFFKNPWALVFFIVLMVVVLLTIFVPYISPYSPFNEVSSSELAANLRPIWVNGGQYEVIKSQQALDRLIAQGYSDAIIKTSPLAGGNLLVTINPYKSDQFMSEINGLVPIFGTNSEGIDIWTLSWYGASQSIGLAAAVGVVSIIIGAIYGAISGSFAGKWPDTIMMRIIEILSGVPSVLWLIILSTVFVGINSTSSGAYQEASNTVLFFSLIVIYWMGPASLTRTYILKNKDAEYIQAIRTLGGSQARIIFVHMLPNISGRLLVRFVHAIPSVIFLEASLVFLGLKSQLNTTLGTLINNNYTDVEFIYPFLCPTLILVSLTLSLQIVANGLNDAIDPRVSGGK